MWWNSQYLPVWVVVIFTTFVGFWWLLRVLCSSPVDVFLSKPAHMWTEIYLKMSGVCGHSMQEREHHGTKLLLRVICTTLFCITRVHPHQSRFRYQTGPGVLDGAALWPQTERAPLRPAKGQRWKMWVGGRGQWLLPSSKDSTPESLAAVAAANFSWRLLMTSCSSDPELLYSERERERERCDGGQFSYTVQACFLTNLWSCLSSVMGCYSNSELQTGHYVIQ